MTTPIRVVVVDDAADIRAIVRYVLDDAGGYCIVAEAGDGQEAVDQCSATQPDLVLLDLSLPTMDGLEALPLIREYAPGTAIVVLSGMAESIAGEAARSAGAVGYIEKGDLIGSLVASLDAIVQRASA